MMFSLQNMLRLLEDELNRLETQQGHEYHAPSPSLLMALYYAIRNPRGLQVRPELITVLERLVRGARYAHTQEGSQNQEILASRAVLEKLEQLRRLYDPRLRPPQRRGAVMPLDDLAELGLHLPANPENQTIPNPAAQPAG